MFGFGRTLTLVLKTNKPTDTAEVFKSSEKLASNLNVTSNKFFQQNLFYLLYAVDIYWFIYSVTNYCTV